MKRVIALSLALVMMLSLVGCGCEHEWKAATCSAPKTCAKCGDTEGAPGSHEWEEATCLKPETCKLCKKTRGEALGHEWEEATLIAPKTCSVCKATQGYSLFDRCETWEEAFGLVFEQEFTVTRVDGPKKVNVDFGEVSSISAFMLDAWYMYIAIGRSTQSGLTCVIRANDGEFVIGGVKTESALHGIVTSLYISNETERKDDIQSSYDSFFTVSGLSV